MATTTTEQPDLWSLLHDLVFGVPAPVLEVVEFTVAALVISAAAIAVIRFAGGDRFELGPLKIDRPNRLGGLEVSLKELSKDDRLKANVLWSFRERLNEANAVISAGIDEPAVRGWSHGVLTDLITALSEGGHDRHRASLWIRNGDDDLRMYNGMGFRQEAVDNARLPIASIAGNVLQTGVKANLADVAAADAFCPKPRSGQGYKSLLAVAVKSAQGKPIAALCIDAEMPGYFDSDHEFFANCFADLLALLIAQVVIGD